MSTGPHTGTPALNMQLNNREKGSPVTRRKRRSSEEIKERLLAAARAEFRTSGYAATTAAIAGKAEVTEGQLYRYFDSKSDLVREAVFKPLNEELAQFSAKYLSLISSMEDRKDRIRKYIDELHQFIKNNPEIIMAITSAKSSSGEDVVPMTELDSLPFYFDVGAVMLEGRQGANPNLNPKLMVKIIFASVLSTAILKDWLFSEATVDQDKLVDDLGEFLIGGVYSNIS